MYYKELAHYVAYFQVITAIIAVTQFYKFKDSYLKYFIVYFCYSVLNEFAAQYYTTFTSATSNAIFYNIYFIVSFLVLFYIYRSSFTNKKLKKAVFSVAFIYIIAIVFEIFYLKINYLTQHQSLAFIVGGIGVIFSIMLYFYKELTTNEIIQIDKKLLFWISASLFIYYIAAVPFYVGRNYFSSKENLHYLFNIFIIMTFIMNIILIIGFLWSGKEKKV